MGSLRIDRQTVDDVTTAIKIASEGPLNVANWNEARAVVPSGGCACVDVAAKSVSPGEILVDVLQVGDAVDQHVRTDRRTELTTIHPGAEIGRRRVAAWVVIEGHETGGLRAERYTAV